MKRQRLLAAKLLCVALTAQIGCVGACDIFNRRATSLPKGYCLELDREFSDYRLQDCGGTRSVVEGVGVLEGTLARIGWNDRVIVAWREPAFGGEKAGWMIVDLLTDRIDGPLSEEELQRSMATDARFQGVTLRSVTDVLH